MQRKKIIFFVAIVCLTLGFTGMIYRAYVIQILRHDRLDKYSRNIEVTRKVKGPRGDIYDRNGEVLAYSQPKIDIAVDPPGIKDKDYMASVLADALNLSEKKIRKILSGRRNFYYLMKNADSGVIDAIRFAKLEAQKKIKEIKRKEGVDKEQITLLNNRVSSFDYIVFVNDYKRVYPRETLLGNVLGFVSKYSGKGVAGIEHRYNEFLKGEEFEVKRFRVPGAGEGVLEVQKEIDRQDRTELYTTIDSRIQFIAEDALSRMVREKKAKWGAAIVMNPSTGKVLAMANYPSYNPQFYNKTKPAERRNYALSNLFEPGSTTKVFTVLGAVNENILKPNELIFCENGRFRYGGSWIRDHKDMGWTTASDIIKYSSNIGVVKIADKMDASKLYEYLSLFGLGRPTKINIPGESWKKIRPYNKWYPIDKANIAFGQGFSLNLMQLTRAFAALHNGGVLWKPVIVDKIVNRKTGKTLYQAIPEPERIDFKYNSDKRVIEMMREVVESGTARRAAVSGLSVGGKTGTSQKYDIKRGRYSWKKVDCIFAGAVPLENPEMVITVIIDEPAGREYGGTAAAPVFGEIARRSLPLLGVYPSGEDGDKNKKERDIKLYEEGNIAKPVASKKSAERVGRFDIVAVPDLRGMRIAKAIHVINQSGLEMAVNTSRSDKIIDQYPLPGEAVSFGTLITVDTEKDFSEKEEINP